MADEKQEYNRFAEKSVSEELESKFYPKPSIKKRPFTSNEIKFIKESSSPLLKKFDTETQGSINISEARLALLKDWLGYSETAVVSAETTSSFTQITSVNLSSAVSAGVLSYNLSNSASELTVYLNGMYMTKNKDYAYSSKKITFISEYSDIIEDNSTLSVLYYT